MKHLLLKLEPIIWLLFGQGILIGTILLTGWIAIVGLAIPMDLVDGSALGYERALELGGSLIGKLVLAALCVLPLWKGAHHIRSLLIDFGGAERDAAVATLLYLVASVGSVVGIIAVVRL